VDNQHSVNTITGPNISILSLTIAQLVQIFLNEFGMGLELTGN